MLWWLLSLRSAGSGRTGSVVEYRLQVLGLRHCGAGASLLLGMGGVFSEQGSNLCPLHFQVDSQPLDDQGSPIFKFLAEQGVGTPNCSTVTCVTTSYIL